MTTPKAQKETVIDEHRDGTPHVTVERTGAPALLERGDGRTVVGMQYRMRHYRAGCEETRRENVIEGRPAQVASESYRSGWDAIDWTKKGGAPS